MTRALCFGSLALALAACGPPQADAGVDGGSDGTETDGDTSGPSTESESASASESSTDESSTEESSTDESESGPDSADSGIPDLPPGANCAELESNLPLVIIDTGGQAIPDDPKIFADLLIIDNGPGQTNCLGDIPTQELTIGIETRGSTSQQYPKKSFGVETRDDLGDDLPVSVLGMPADSDWVLYAPYPDKTMVRNALAFDLHRQMGHYSSRTRHVEVVLNGQYWGVYVWMERIERSPGRVDITDLDPPDIAGDALTGGYIVKVDKLTGNVGASWDSPYSSEVTLQVHYPKPSKIAAEQAQYIQAAVTQFEDALAGPDFADPQLGYPAWIDAESFMDFMILQELGRTVDGYRSSSFFYKDRDSVDGRFVAGPMWDFNLSFGNADYCEAFSTTGYQYEFDDICGDFFDVEIPFWWQRLLEDPAFADALRCRWEALREGPLADEAIAAFVDARAEELADAQVRNFERWPILGTYVNWNAFVGETYEEEIDYLETWIGDRALWLDDNFAGVCG